MWTLWLIFMMPLAFVVYFIAVSAELNRTPTDIAEAESEIVAGYLTEYSGMKWGLFYGMDIGYALAASAFAATIFLGGWSMWGLEQWVPPWLIFIAKTHLFYFVFIWTRGTLPRLRIDQLMGFAWKFLLPLAVFNLFLVALEKLWWSEANLDDSIVFAFAAINFVVSAAFRVPVGAPSATSRSGSPRGRGWCGTRAATCRSQRSPASGDGDGGLDGLRGHASSPSGCSPSIAVVAQPSA